MSGEGPRPWYLDPYLHVGLSAVLISIGEVFLKKGADASAAAGATAVLGVGALGAPATWIGIVLSVVSFGSWLHVLRLLPVSQAFALISAVHVLVPLAALLFLGEAVPLARWAGIALVIAGTLLMAAPAAEAEERL